MNLHDFTDKKAIRWDFLIESKTRLPLVSWSCSLQCCDVMLGVISVQCCISCVLKLYISGHLDSGDAGFLCDWWSLGGAVLPHRPLPQSVTDTRRPVAAPRCCGSCLFVHSPPVFYVLSPKTEPRHAHVHGATWPWWLISRDGTSSVEGTKMVNKVITRQSRCNKHLLCNIIIYLFIYPVSINGLVYKISENIEKTLFPRGHPYMFIMPLFVQT